MWNTRVLLAAALVAATGLQADAQWTSGSNGSDGALNITAAGVTELDPVALGLDADGDNTFHFTTITIAAGSTLRLRGNKLRGRSVVWLASGAVNIAGTLDLSGSPGHAWNDTANRARSEPGPGGFPGGAGRTSSVNAQAGLGPGGGAPGIEDRSGCSGSYATRGACHTTASQAPEYGNAILVPLVGGSGGGGGAGRLNQAPSSPATGAGGGAGGGAIRISSTVSISVPGSIRADGGAAGQGIYESGTYHFHGGAGSGGSIHLQAPTVTVAGSIRADAGAGVTAGTINNSYPGASGRIRVDAATQTLSGAVSPAARIGPLQTIPAVAPTLVRISDVAGQAISTSTSGDLQSVDVTIDAAGPVTIQVVAQNVPLGTVVKLWITSEGGADQVVDTTALAGTLSSSSASATATLPAGVSRLIAQAKW